MRPIDFAESTMNSATSFAADPVTTSTFQPPAAAVDFSITPALRWASCRSHDQKIQAARRVANGARRDRTRQAARVAFEAFFKPHEGPQGVTLPAALWLVSAQV